MTSSTQQDRTSTITLRTKVMRAVAAIGLGTVLATSLGFGAAMTHATAAASPSVAATSPSALGGPGAL